MSSRRLRLLHCAALLGLVAACSNYFGPGPDPSRAGPFEGVSGRSNLGGTNVGGTKSFGGDVNVGNNGNMGGSSSCQAQTPLDAVLEVGNADCADVKSCAETSCGDEVQQCLGPNYARGNVSGPCMSYVGCQNGCGCNDGCRSGCLGSADSSSCVDCLVTLQDCLHQNCPNELAACQDASGKPTVLAANLGNNVTALAPDGDSLFFTTMTGIAEVPKAGGKPMALGGYKNLNGLAIADGFIYFSIDNGGVMRMKLDGTEPMQIVTTTFGGGSGSIVVDAANLYYLSGPYLRRAPRAGGMAEELTDDVWQQGFNGGLRLALDDRALYYVGGGGMPGSTPQLMEVSKDAPAIGNSPPNMHPGTSLFTAKGEIRGIVTDGAVVYFTDFGSDGLKLALDVESIDPLSKKTKVLGSVSVMNNNGGSTGIATDGERVFFGAGSGLYSVSANGGDLKTVVTDAMPSAIALDDQYIYWAEQNASGSIKRLPKASAP